MASRLDPAFLKSLRTLLPADSLLTAPEDYSILQPEIASQLKARKLGHLQAGAPEMIVTANIGCLTHLQSGTTIPVRHWVELLDDALAAH